MYDLESPHHVNCIDREEWSQGEPNHAINAPTWYRDGSKGAGSGVYGVRPSFSQSLGLVTTVFQAKLIRLTDCVRINIDGGYNDNTVYMNSDGGESLMALSKLKYTSRIVWDCLVSSRPEIWQKPIK